MKNNPQPIHKRTLLEDAISEYEYITLNGTILEVTDEVVKIEPYDCADNTMEELPKVKQFEESVNFEASNNNTSPFTLLTAQSTEKMQNLQPKTMVDKNSSHQDSKIPVANSKKSPFNYDRANFSKFRNNFEQPSQGRNKLKVEKYPTEYS